MKFNRDLLQQNKYSVFLQREGQKKPYRVMFPESVDTDTGTVELWYIPHESADALLKPEQMTEARMKEKPVEIDGFALLRTDTGKVFVLDPDGGVVAESK